MQKSNKPQQFLREANRSTHVVRMLRSNKIEVSDEEMAYFREHPEEIDEVTAATRVHRFFLGAGMIAGVSAVAVSKAIDSVQLEAAIGPILADLLVSVIFEGGGALIGASLTAYFMGTLLNNQQERAKAFRKEIRRRLREDP